MPSRRCNRIRFWNTLVAGVVGLTVLPLPVNAQGTSGPTVSDSKVGYIDSAIPGSQFRLRFDPAYNNRRPSRAEFFWAQGAPSGPGVPFPETSVDYQALSAYTEVACTDRFSVFGEFAARILNPEVNANTAGLSDLNAGFKYALLQSDNGVVTFQFRTYAPTGDADRGLGTRHVSLEPALLSYCALTDRLRLEGELRYWVPVGGTDFAGDVLRYGAGFSYNLFHGNGWRITPVAEFVGWTVLGGKETAVQPGGTISLADATGDTIVNAKLGLRVGLGDRADIYGGYGRPLTGERWYENTFRLELRLLY